VRRGDLKPVTIPMAPGVESLNVAAAAAILFFELRRRQAAQPARAGEDVM
jgi:tRNA G18 (ribose-2'-O)-methylase SpoU